MTFDLDAARPRQQVVELMVDGSTPSEDGRRHNLNPKESVALLRKP